MTIKKSTMPIRFLGYKVSFLCLHHIWNNIINYAHYILFSWKKTKQGCAGEFKMKLLIKLGKKTSVYINTLTDYNNPAGYLNSYYWHSNKYCLVLLLHEYMVVFSLRWSLPLVRLYRPLVTIKMHYIYQHTVLPWM